MLKNRLRNMAWGGMAVGVLLMATGWLISGTLLSAVGFIVLGLSPDTVRSGTDLFVAVEIRDTVTLRRMLAAGADPNTRGPGGPSLLEAAVRRRAIPAVDLLLAHGADPDATGPGQDSALALAAFRNQRPSASLLVNAGANPNTPNPGRLGGTPLSLAVDGGHERLSQTLLAGATVDVGTLRDLERTALAHGNQGIARLLVERRVQAGVEKAPDEPAA